MIGNAAGASRRTVWLGTGWKMNKTIDEAREYARVLAAAELPTGVSCFVLPPFTALAAVRAALPADSPFRIGAQNAHWESEGAWTGEISMGMAADAGATLVEIGHSERREHFGETDETVSLKTRAALDAGLTPLVCLGEPADVRDAGLAEDFVVAQVRQALRFVGRGQVRSLLVAYEPIWAIGHRGRPATAAETGPVMAALARELRATSDGSGPLGLLYGGSVDLSNAAGLLDDPSTDGLFVGRAAWRPDGLLALVDIAARHVKTR